MGHYIKDINSLVGLLPKGAMGYKLDQASRRFYTYSKGLCGYSLEGSYELKYKSTISGYIAENRLSSLTACAKIADISLEAMGSHCKSLKTLSLDSEYMSNKGLLAVAKGCNIRTMGLGYAAAPIDGVIIVKREVAVVIKKILVFDPGGGTIVGKNIAPCGHKVLLWGWLVTLLQ